MVICWFCCRRFLKSEQKLYDTKENCPTLAVLVYRIPSKQKQTENRERAEKHITGSRLLFLASPTNCKTTVDMEFCKWVWRWNYFVPFKTWFFFYGDLCVNHGEGKSMNLQFEVLPVSYFYPEQIVILLKLITVGRNICHSAVSAWVMKFCFGK